jgi:hypothetical protein
MAPVPDRAAVGVLGADGTDVADPDDGAATGIAGAVTARAADVPLAPLPATLVPVMAQVYEPAVVGVWVDVEALATVTPSRCQVYVREPGMRERRAPGTSAAHVASLHVSGLLVTPEPETVGLPVVLGDSTIHSDAIGWPAPESSVDCVQEATDELRLMSPIVLA